MILYKSCKAKCECSSMVEFQPSKLVAWVRFPSLAPICAHSSVDRVPGYEPVGRRFESSWARHGEYRICLVRQMRYFLTKVKE